MFKKPSTICMIVSWAFTRSGTEASIYLLNTVILPESKSRNFIHERDSNKESVEARDGFHLLQNHRRQREFTQNTPHDITTHLLLLWGGVSLFCGRLKLTWSHLLLHLHYSVSQQSFLIWLHAPLICLHTSWFVFSLLRAQGSKAHTWLKNVRCTYILLGITEI